MGGVSHQSPGYGLVGSGTYEFTPGSYSITLQHYGTNLDSPDYDYTASVEKVSGGARVTVEDPQGTHRQLNTDVLHTHQHFNDHKSQHVTLQSAVFIYEI